MLWLRFRQEIKRRTKTGCLTCRKRRIKVRRPPVASLLLLGPESQAACPPAPRIIVGFELADPGPCFETVCMPRGWRARRRCVGRVSPRRSLAVASLPDFGALVSSQASERAVDLRPPPKTAPPRPSSPAIQPSVAKLLPLHQSHFLDSLTCPPPCLPRSNMTRLA